jgi:hypothetical protein
MDHLSQELKTRFYEGQRDGLEGWSIIPGRMTQLGINWQISFKTFCASYQQFLPHYNSLDAEIMLWDRKRERVRDGEDPLPGTAALTLASADPIIFPNITMALRILCTFPVTTCECERSVSALRKLKTYSRSTMGEQRLSALGLMYVHHSKKIDTKKVVTRFAQLHPRKLELIDILNSDV